METKQPVMNKELDIKVIHQEVQKVGKNIKTSKKYYGWRFSINSIDNRVDFFDSLITGKKKVVYNDKVLLKITKHGKFGFEFKIQNVPISISSNNDSYLLYINKKSFNYYFYNQITNSFNNKTKGDTPSPSESKKTKKEEFVDDNIHKKDLTLKDSFLQPVESRTKESRTPERLTIPKDEKLPKSDESFAKNSKPDYQQLIDDPNMTFNPRHQSLNVISNPFINYEKDPKSLDKPILETPYLGKPDKLKQSEVNLLDGGFETTPPLLSEPNKISIQSPKLPENNKIPSPSLKNEAKKSPTNSNNNNNNHLQPSLSTEPNRNPSPSKIIPPNNNITNTNNRYPSLPNNNNTNNTINPPQFNTTTQKNITNPFSEILTYTKEVPTQPKTRTFDDLLVFDHEDLSYNTNTNNKNPLQPSVQQQSIDKQIIVKKEAEFSQSQIIQPEDSTTNSILPKKKESEMMPQSHVIKPDDSTISISKKNEIPQQPLQQQSNLVKHEEQVPNVSLPKDASLDSELKFLKDQILLLDSKLNSHITTTKKNESILQNNNKKCVEGILNINNEIIKINKQFNTLPDQRKLFDAKLEGKIENFIKQYNEGMKNLGKINESSQVFMQEIKLRNEKMDNFFNQNRKELDLLIENKIKFHINNPNFDSVNSSKVSFLTSGNPNPNNNHFDSVTSGKIISEHKINVENSTTAANWDEINETIRITNQNLTQLIMDEIDSKEKQILKKFDQKTQNFQANFDKIQQELDSLKKSFKENIKNLEERSPYVVSPEANISGEKKLEIEIEKKSKLDQINNDSVKSNIKQAPSYNLVVNRQVYEVPEVQETQNRVNEMKKQIDVMNKQLGETIFNLEQNVSQITTYINNKFSEIFIYFVKITHLYPNKESMGLLEKDLMSKINKENFDPKELLTPLSIHSADEFYENDSFAEDKPIMRDKPKVTPEKENINYWTLTALYPEDLEKIFSKEKINLPKIELINIKESNLVKDSIERTHKILFINYKKQIFEEMIQNISQNFEHKVLDLEKELFEENHESINNDNLAELIDYSKLSKALSNAMF